MTTQAKALLCWLYEDYLNDVYPQRVQAEDLGMSQQELIRAGNELKRLDYLPDFKAKESAKNIAFFGCLTKEAIEYAKNLND